MTKDERPSAPGDRVKVKRHGPTRPWQENLDRYKSSGEKQPVDGVEPSARLEPAHSSPAQAEPREPLRAVEHMPPAPMLARALAQVGRSYHGFELQGVENVPREGAAFLLLHKGPIPFDAWYLAQEIAVRTGRRVVAAVDRRWFLLPGSRLFAGAAGLLPADSTSVAAVLDAGDVVIASAEDLEDDRKSSGSSDGSSARYAGIARAARAELIPVFIENAGQMFLRAPAPLRPLEKLYETTRFPFPPVFGMGPFPLPVKLRSWIGQPIRSGFVEPAEAFAARAEGALERLTLEHGGEERSTAAAVRMRFF